MYFPSVVGSDSGVSITSLDAGWWDNTNTFPVAQLSVLCVDECIA